MAINFIVVRKRSRRAVKRILSGIYSPSLNFSDSRNSQYCTLWN